jgi:undecaprenyl-diphosphatase
VLLAVARAWIEWVGPLPGDRWSFDARPVAFQRYPLREVVQMFNAVGTPLIAGPLVVAATYLVWRGLGRISATFVAIASVGTVPSYIMKAIAGPTPLKVGQPGVREGNFPSGHVVFATVFFGALLLLARRHRRRDLMLIAFIAIALMGPFRIVDGSHVLSDVIAGYAFGAAWLVISAWAAERSEQRVANTVSGV